MKKCFQLLLVCFLGFTSMASAQDNIIKVQPLGLAFGTLNATYERVLNDQSSFLASASARFSLFGVDVTLIGVGAGWRYYLTNKRTDVPKGLYVNPQVGFSFGSVNEGDLDNSFTTFGIGAEIGYQWVWDSGVVLDLGIGPNYTVISGQVDDVGFDNTSGILPSMTVALGYAF